MPPSTWWSNTSGAGSRTTPSRLTLQRLPPSWTPKPTSHTACEAFDLTAFEAITEGAIEPTVTLAAANVDNHPGVMYCQYTADSGMTLDVTAVADTSADYAEHKQRH